MIPTRSRLAKSLSFQLVVDRDDTDLFHSRHPRHGLQGAQVCPSHLSCRRLLSPIPRGDQDRPLGNRVKQVVSQTVLAVDAPVRRLMQASGKVASFLGVTPLNYALCVPVPRRTARPSTTTAKRSLPQQNDWGFCPRVLWSPSGLLLCILGNYLLFSA